MINLICGKQKHLQKKRSIKRTSIETLFYINKVLDISVIISKATFFSSFRFIHCPIVSFNNICRE